MSENVKFDVDQLSFLVSAVRQKILFPSIFEQSEEPQNQILQSDSDDESDSDEENNKSETQDAVRWNIAVNNFKDVKLVFFINIFYITH